MQSKGKFGRKYGRKCNSNQWWNNNIYQCERSKSHLCEKDYVLNPTTCNCKYYGCFSDYL